MLLQPFTRHTTSTQCDRTEPRAGLPVVQRAGAREYIGADSPILRACPRQAGQGRSGDRRSEASNSSSVPNNLLPDHTPKESAMVLGRSLVFVALLLSLAGCASVTRDTWAGASDHLQETHRACLDKCCPRCRNRLEGKHAASGRPATSVRPSRTPWLRPSSAACTSTTCGTRSLRGS